MLVRDARTARSHKMQKHAKICKDVQKYKKHAKTHGSAHDMIVPARCLHKMASCQPTMPRNPGRSIICAHDSTPRGEHEHAKRCAAKYGSTNKHCANNARIIVQNHRRHNQLLLLVSRSPIICIAAAQLSTWHHGPKTNASTG